MNAGYYLPYIDSISCIQVKLDLSTSANAKQNLILAAIRLLAEDGVDAVSLRMINREAGSKNNSALHYHFGSKLGLVAAVAEFIQQHFDAVREPAIAELETRAAGDGVTLAEVMRVFTMAYVDIIEGFDWGYAAIRTLARMEFDGSEEVHNLLSRSAGTSVNRFAKLKRPRLLHLSARQFKVRHNFVVNTTIRGFADYRNLNRSYYGDLSVKNLQELARFYAGVGVAVLSAPT